MVLVLAPIDISTLHDVCAYACVRACMTTTIEERIVSPYVIRQTLFSGKFLLTIRAPVRSLASVYSAFRIMWKDEGQTD